MAGQLVSTLDMESSVLMNLSELLRDTEREKTHKMVTPSAIDYKLRKLKHAGDPLAVEPRLRRLLLTASPSPG